MCSGQEITEILPLDTTSWSFEFLADIFEVSVVSFPLIVTSSIRLMSTGKSIEFSIQNLVFVMDLIDSFIYGKLYLVFLRSLESLLPKYRRRNIKS